MRKLFLRYRNWARPNTSPRLQSESQTSLRPPRRNGPKSVGTWLATMYAVGIAAWFGMSTPTFAEDAPPPTAAELATRVADLEAYIKNAAPTALIETPGPGHNAWLMTSSALVLFMTLPGLALFYGGLFAARTSCRSARSALRWRAS